MRIKICPIGRDLGDGRMIAEGAPIHWERATPVMSNASDGTRGTRLVGVTNNIAVEDGHLVADLQLIGDGDELWAAGYRLSPTFSHDDWEFHTPEEWDALTGSTGSLGGAAMTRGQVVRFALVSAEQAPGGAVTGTPEETK